MSSAAEVLAVLERIPYARFLGVGATVHGDEMTAILPYAEHLLGNPTLPALHGGVIGAFMEITALAQLLIAEKLMRPPRPVDISVEFLRSGRPLPTYARAQINKGGRRVANVQGEAWQEERARPIAALRGHFLLTPVEEITAG